MSPLYHIVHCFLEKNCGESCASNVVSSGTVRYNLAMKSSVSRFKADQPSVVSLITVNEACARMSIGRSHLYSLIREGRIRTVPIGRRGIRISLGEIERFIEESMARAEGGEPWR